MRTFRREQAQILHKEPDMADFLFINPSSNPELLHQLLAVKSVAEAAPRQHVLGIRLPRA